MSTALYRRYRPETFQEVIGQGHVTEPLTAALRADRANHAYLFSGPRGCGKTTSARILARCLNCAQGPTDTPCGECASCVELARGGPGSLDVVEIDAASHNGVDDARELRERASFAPARDRYKIFVLDEAHMVTAQGFNALLKLVEEPPEHVKFIFATTEPEKVIGTIRSRTHHYPFRLVPPEQLLGYLERLCEAEGVQVAGGVLPMVVRAGGGSVRDTLSVLDQLLAGAAEGGLDYDRAIALLGYTDAALLDDVVDALAARDGASLFRVVDRVIESGHDPRRFVEDLLERLRDLVVIAMAGDHAAAALRGLPEDQLERMRAQAQHLRGAQISRAADLVNDALTEMSGATSPRLQLELLCARLLLPGADDGDAGFGARLDRVERQLAHGGSGTVADSSPSSAMPALSAGRPATAPLQPTPPAEPTEPSEQAQPAPAPVPDAAESSQAVPAVPATPATWDVAAAQPSAAQSPAAAEPNAPEVPAPAPADSESPEPARPEPESSEPVPSTAVTGEPVPAEPVPAEPVPAEPQRTEPGADAEMIRHRWSEVVATLARLRRGTWALVSQNAQVGGVSDGTLRLLFSTSGLASTFRNGAHAEHVERALVETLGMQLRVEGVVDEPGSGGGPAGAPAPSGPVTSPSAVADARTSWASPATPARSVSASSPDTGGQPRGAGSAGPAAERSAGPAVPPAQPAGTQQPRGAQPQGGAQQRPEAAQRPQHSGSQRPGPDAGPAPAAPSEAAEPAEDDPEQAEPQSAAVQVEPPSAAGRSEGVATSGSPPSASSAPVAAPHPRVSPADDVPSADDPDAERSGMVGAPLVAQLLGGTVIEEIDSTDGTRT